MFILINISHAENTTKKPGYEILLKKALFRVAPKWKKFEKYMKVIKIDEKHVFIKNHSLYEIMVLPPSFPVHCTVLFAAMGNDKKAHILYFNNNNAAEFNTMVRDESISIRNEEDAEKYFLRMFPLTTYGHEELINNIEEMDQFDLDFVKFASKDENRKAGEESEYDIFKREIKPVKVTKDGMNYIIDYYTYIILLIRVKHRKTIINERGEVTSNKEESIHTGMRYNP
ncbi:MAG: hypothetical protein M1269_04890 [Chloroflexi bacterium]|nr:hypothetical protein [Chloroflexota bacterium]